MKSNRINYLIVGTFVIAMVVALVASIALLTGRTGATDRYFTSYRDVSGIKFGTQVMYMGYPVGQVESVEPVPTDDGVDFLIELSVREGWRIPADSIARITSAGLLSAVTIDIREGDGPELLEPGGRIRGAERASLFAAVSATASTVKDLVENSVRPLLDGMSRLVEEDARGLMSDLKTVTSRLAEEGPVVVADIHAVSARLREMSEELQKVVNARNTARLDATIENAAELSGNFRQVSEDARAVSGNLRQILDADAVQRIDAALASVARASDSLDQLLGPDTADRIDATLDNVAHASDNMSAASDELKNALSARNSARVSIALENVEEASDNVRVASEDVRAASGNVKRMLGPRTAKRVDTTLDNIAAASGELRGMLGPDTGGKIDRMLDNVSSASANIAVLSAELKTSRAKLDRILDAVGDTVVERKPELSQSIGDLRYILETIAENISAVSHNLEGTSRNMYEFSRHIRANPGLLIGGTPPREDAVQADE